MELWWEGAWVRGDRRRQSLFYQGRHEPVDWASNLRFTEPGAGDGLGLASLGPPLPRWPKKQSRRKSNPTQPSKHRLGWNCSTTPMGSAPESDLSKVTEQSGAELGLRPRFPGFCARVGRLPRQGRVAWLTPDSRQAASLSPALVFFICKMERTHGSTKKKYKFLEPCRSL